MADIAAEEVTDYEVTQMAIDSRLVELHTSFPAKVESYSASAQTVDVVPCLNRAVPNGDGEHVTEALPKIAGVPVCFPRCGSFFVSFPIQAGDYVLVVCAQRNIGNWRATGNAGDPGDLGMHTLDGAIAIPGVFPDAKAIKSADATNMVLGSDTDPGGRVVIKADGVELGGGADYVSLAAKVDGELAKIAATLGSLTGGATVAAAFTVAYTRAGTAASKVKAT